MYNQQLEELIDAALADGVLTEKKKQILFKKAKAEGIDLDEFEMVINARILKVNQTQQLGHQVKEKKGNIITCPNCGAHVSALTGICPECGHEFTNVGIISSVQKLTDIIENIANTTKSQTARWKKMANAISSFPIPNARADLFEFAVSMRSKMGDTLGTGESTDTEPGALLMTAYFNKYKECLSKISAQYATDPIFSNLLSTYHSDVKKAQRAIFRQRYGFLIALIVFLVLIFIIIGVILLLKA